MSRHMPADPLATATNRVVRAMTDVDIAEAEVGDFARMRRDAERRLVVCRRRLLARQAELAAVKAGVA